MRLLVRFLGFLFAAGTILFLVGVSAVAGNAGSPHGPGWVGLGVAENEHGRAARRDPVACASCHGGAGEALCVSCHKVGGPGGNPHPPGYSSQQPMTAMPCRMCHTQALSR